MYYELMSKLITARAQFLAEAREVKGELIGAFDFPFDVHFYVETQSFAIVDLDSLRAVKIKAFEERLNNTLKNGNMNPITIEEFNEAYKQHSAKYRSEAYTLNLK